MILTFTRHEMEMMLMIVRFYLGEQSFTSDPMDPHHGQVAELEAMFEKALEPGAELPQPEDTKK